MANPFDVAEQASAPSANPFDLAEKALAVPELSNPFDIAQVAMPRSGRADLSNLVNPIAQPGQGRGKALGKQLVEGGKSAWDLLTTTPEFVTDAVAPFQATPQQKLLGAAKQLNLATEVTPPAVEDENAAISMPRTERVLGGVRQAAGDFAGFFTTPLGVATLGMGALPAAIQKSVAALFAAQMASQTPELARQLGDELGKPAEQQDTQKIARLVTNAALNTGFTVAGAVHALPEAVRGGVADTVTQEVPPAGGTAKNSQSPGGATTAENPFDVAEKMTGQAVPSPGAPTDNIGARMAAANPQAVVRTPDGAVDTVQTAINAMKQAQPAPTGGAAPSVAATGGKAPITAEAPGSTPTIAERAKAEPDRPVTMADLSALVDEIKNKDRFAPSGAGKVESPTAPTGLSKILLSTDEAKPGGRAAIQAIADKYGLSWDDAVKVVSANRDRLGITKDLAPSEQSDQVKTESPQEAAPATPAPAGAATPSDVEPLSQDKKLGQRSTVALPEEKASPGETFRGKAEQLALKLEDLKSGIRSGTSGQTHLFGVAADLWDRAVSAAQAIIRAGGSVVDAVEAAIRHIRENHTGKFDEAGARKAIGDAVGQRDAGPDRPERERSAAQVRGELTQAEADLKKATVRDAAKQSQSEYKQAAALAGAQYRTLRDELLNHPEHVADTLLKQQAAVTEANELLKPLGQAVHPEELPDQSALRAKLTPEQFKRYQELQEQIVAAHAEIGRMPKKLVARVDTELRDQGKLPKAAEPDQNVGRSLDRVTDWLRANGVDSPRKTLAERFNLADRWRTMVQGARTSLQKALQTARSLTAAAVESYKSPPKDDDFRSVIKSWIFADQRTGLATHQFVRELVAKVPNAARRRAMSIWLDADGDKSLLEFQAQTVPEAYAKDWKLALNLTPDEQALATQIRDDFAKKLEDGQATGLIDRGRQDYGVPQRWKLKPDTEKDFTGDEKKGSPGRINAKLDPRDPFFSFQREVPTYFEGIMAKGVPENLDIAHLVATYDQAFHKSLSSRGMIAALQEARAKDGLPVTKISGSARIATSEDGKAYFVDSKAWNKSDVSADGRPYRSLDHSALKGWKIAMKDEKGNPIIVKGDMLIHPDHFDYLKNELGQSALREIPLVGAALRSQAFLKASKLSGSAFHLMTIGEHMASHLVNPFLNGFKLDLRAPDQALLVRNGLEIGMGSPQMAYEEGLASAHSGLFNKVPVLGDASAKLTDWMFKDYIPSIMMKVGLHALESNRKRYGDKLTPDQVAELTAQQMNAAGGLLNYRLRGSDDNFWGKLGANKTLMDLQRMALMAPQFLEARMRVVGQALKPYGHEQRKMLLTQVVVLYVGARVLNQLLDGDPHWTDNPFSVVYHGRAYSIRTIVGDFWHLITDPASFASGRLSPFLKMGIEDVAAGGRDMRTGARKETPIETQNPVGRMAQNLVMDMVNWLTPIPVEGMLPGAKGRDQTAASMLLSSVGVGSRKFTAVNQVRDLAADFNRKSPDPNVQRMQADRDNGSFGHSAYAKLDSLLDAGDMAGARKELAALQKDGIPLARITSRYERQAPFTGSAAREKDFVAQLTPKQRELYQKARDEQAKRSQAFDALTP